MRYIVQGSQSEQRFNMLLKLTRISSEDVIDALRDHLVVGLAETTAATINNVSLSNFNRALTSLNAAAELVEKIKELDWSAFRANQLTDNKI